MIRVRYFASLREVMGRGEASFDLPPMVKTGRDLVNLLAAQFPHAEDALNAQQPQDRQSTTRWRRSTRRSLALKKSRYCHR